MKPLEVRLEDLVLGRVDHRDRHVRNGRLKRIVARGRHRHRPQTLPRGLGRAPGSSRPYIAVAAASGSHVIPPRSSCAGHGKPGRVRRGAPGGGGTPPRRGHRCTTEGARRSVRQQRRRSPSRASGRRSPRGRRLRTAARRPARCARRNRPRDRGSGRSGASTACPRALKALRPKTLSTSRRATRRGVGRRWPSRRPGSRGARQ